MDEAPRAGAGFQAHVWDDALADKAADDGLELRSGDWWHAELRGGGGGGLGGDRDEWVHGFFELVEKSGGGHTPIIKGGGCRGIGEHVITVCPNRDRDIQGNVGAPLQILRKWTQHRLTEHYSLGCAVSRIGNRHQVNVGGQSYRIPTILEIRDRV